MAADPHHSARHSVDRGRGAPYRPRVTRRTGRFTGMRKLLLFSVGLLAIAVFASPGVAGASHPDFKRGDCTIGGTNGPDHLIGTPGPDVICAIGGNDFIRGNGGDDSIAAGAGNDTV